MLFLLFFPFLNFLFLQFLHRLPPRKTRPGSQPPKTDFFYGLPSGPFPLPTGKTEQIYDCNVPSLAPKCRQARLRGTIHALKAQKKKKKNFQNDWIQRGMVSLAGFFTWKCRAELLCCCGLEGLWVFFLSVQPCFWKGIVDLKKCL